LLGCISTASKDENVTEACATLWLKGIYINAIVAILGAILLVVGLIGFIGIVVIL
jgi:hypothetical protein